MTLDRNLVRTQARGHWRAILQPLAPALEPALERPGRHGPCPIHGGADGFRLFRDVNETGGGICNCTKYLRACIAILHALHD
jgi:phage/plasmid primase-like uncharacterized protein